MTVISSHCGKREITCCHWQNQKQCTVIFEEKNNFLQPLRHVPPHPQTTHDKAVISTSLNTLRVRDAFYSILCFKTKHHCCCSLYESGGCFWILMTLIGVLSIRSSLTEQMLSVGCSHVVDSLCNTSSDKDVFLWTDCWLHGSCFVVYWIFSPVSIL